jgi:hypothetical protein
LRCRAGKNSPSSIWWMRGCCHCDSQVFGEDDSQSTNRLILECGSQPPLPLVTGDVSTALQAGLGHIAVVADAKSAGYFYLPNDRRGSKTSNRVVPLVRVMPHIARASEPIKRSILDGDRRSVPLTRSLQFNFWAMPIILLAPTVSVSSRLTFSGAVLLRERPRRPGACLRNAVETEQRH